MQPTHDYGSDSDEGKDESHVRLRPAERIVARERGDRIAAAKNREQQDRVGEHPCEEQVRADVRVVVLRGLLLFRYAGRPRVRLCAGPLVLDVLERLLVYVVHGRGVDDFDVDL